MASNPFGEDDDDIDITKLLQSHIEVRLDTYGESFNCSNSGCVKNHRMPRDCKRSTYPVRQMS